MVQAHQMPSSSTASALQATVFGSAITFNQIVRNTRDCVLTRSQNWFCAIVNPLQPKLIVAYFLNFYLKIQKNIRKCYVSWITLKLVHYFIE